MSVEFKDNSMHVKAEINDVTIGWLYECAGVLQGRVQQNTKGGHSGLRDKWQYTVDEQKGEAIVGHPWQLAIWYEFGTGSYAQNGDGRKAWWVYVKDEYNGQTSPFPSTGGEVYTREEAIRVASFLRSKGLDAHATCGMTPKRPFQTAFESLKEVFKTALQNKLKGMK